MRGALDGVRIVECAQGIAAPYAAMLLAEQGAEVIKIEPPGGDRARSLPGFHVWNRSKRSVIADITSAAGRQQVRALCADADVFMSEVVHQDPALQYETLAAGNTGLISCVMPPYGSDGPQANALATDDLVAARSSLLANQWANREGPAFLTVPVASYGAAMLAAGAVCAALLAREASGRGQVVEVSWLAGALAMQTGSVIEHQALQRVMMMVRDPQGTIPVYRLFKASDGWLFLACGNTTFWNKLCLVLERPEMVSDPRFEGAPWAVAPAHWAELKALVQSIIATRPRDEWLRLLNEVDIPCAPVLTRFDFLADPQVQHQGMRQDVEDPELGATVQMGLPVHLRGTPGAIRGPAPSRAAAAAARGEVTWSARRTATPAGVEASRPHGSGPLAGTLVLDFTNYIAGPSAAMALALAGADVIKIEPPQGDPFRVFGFGFYGWNQGKRGVALDFSKAAAREVVYDLVRRADVLVENLRPGATRRLGIDYDTVSAINSRLVYGSLTAFGSSGPRGHEAGFDPLLQARSGLMAAQGGHGRDPVFLTCAVCDYAAGLLCAFGVVAALFARQRSGQGQLVETSLAQAAMAGQSGEFIFYDGRPDMENGGPDLLGRHLLRRAYGCRDGWIFISAGAQHWQPLKALARGWGLSVPATSAPLEEPPDGATGTWLGNAFATRSRDEVLSQLAGVGVPAAPVLGVAELFRDAQVAANDLLYVGRAPSWGEFRQTGALVKYAATPVAVERSAPQLGEHTVDILEQLLAYPPARIAALEADGVIISPKP